MRAKTLLSAARGAVLAALLVPAPVFDADAREIKDMAGNTVIVPDHIHKVFAMSHAFAPMLAIAPDLLAGVAAPTRPNPDILAFLPPAVAEMPLLGGGNDANLEKLKDAGIDVALGWVTGDEPYPTEKLGRIGVPVAAIQVDRLEQYPGTFRFLGRLLGREARGEVLAREIEADLDRLRRLAAAVPAAERARVYYTESMDGLTSQCEGADRAEVVALAGGVNAVTCESGGPIGRRPLDIETLLSINPEVIVARFPQAAQLAKTDPRWSRLKAVSGGRVLASPNLPYNWFDRPPSFMRALGALWLAKTLYPARVDIDLRAEAARFDELFFGVRPSDAALDKLFAP